MLFQAQWKHGEKRPATSPRVAVSLAILHLNVLSGNCLLSCVGAGGVLSVIFWQPPVEDSGPWHRLTELTIGSSSGGASSAPVRAYSP